MAKTQVTTTARLRPGKCAISGDTTGPFLDTGNDIPRYGRIYLSFKWLDEHLRNAGYIHEDDVNEMREFNQKLIEDNGKLTEDSQTLQNLLDEIMPYMPEVEPKVVEKPVTTYRAPSDDEIQDWIERNGGNHPAVRAARPYEPGSSEEWHRLYGHLKTPEAQRRRPQDQAKAAEPEEPTSVTEDGGPTRRVNVYDQEVDLDTVLSQNVQDAVAFAEGKGDDFIRALVTREFYLADQSERSPRKGLLSPLGYWDDEENEALVPAEFADDDETIDTDDEEE